MKYNQYGLESPNVGTLVKLDEAEARIAELEEAILEYCGDCLVDDEGRWCRDVCPLRIIRGA